MKHHLLFTTVLLVSTLSCESERFEAQMSSLNSQLRPIVIGDPDTDLKPDFCFPGASEENPGCPALISASEAEAISKSFQYADPYTSPDFPKGFDRDQYKQPQQLIDITSSGENLQLSPNFVLGEFLSIAKGRFGLLSRAVFDRIQEMRAEIDRPMRITSGYRSPGYNAGISGAAKWSRHTYGDAIDFSVAGMNFQQLRDLCLKHGANFFQIYSGHIHCDWRGTALDSTLFPVTNPEPAFVRTASLLSQAIEISASRNPEGLWQVAFSGIEAEDGDTIEVNWVITSPSGKTIERQGPSVLFSPTETGLHQVHVNVGGSVSTTKGVLVD